MLSHNFFFLFFWCVSLLSKWYAWENRITAAGHTYTQFMKWSFISNDWQTVALSCGVDVIASFVVPSRYLFICLSSSQAFVGRLPRRYLYGLLERHKLCMVHILWNHVTRLLVSDGWFLRALQVILSSKSFVYCFMLWHHGIRLFLILSLYSSVSFNLISFVASCIFNAYKCGVN